MKRYLILNVLLVVFLFASNYDAVAQAFITVKGKVTGVNGNGLDKVSIYYYKTVEEAHHFEYEAKNNRKDFYNKNGQGDFLSRRNGDFETGHVDPYGALLFVYGTDYEPTLVEINGSDRIDVQINDAVQLPEGTTTAKPDITDNPIINKPTSKLGHHSVTYRYTFSEEKLGTVEKVGRTNARLVAQMVVVSYDGKDTLMYLPPIVHDGVEFHITQALYNPDTLYRIAHNTARLDNLPDKKRLIFDLDFQVPAEDTTRYVCKANIWIRDYNQIYYSDELPALYDTDRTSRPYQFLEHSCSTYALPFDAYVRKASPTMLPTEKNMKLKFKVGRAELDMSDSATVAALDALKAEFRQIRVSDDQTLTSLEFEGTSSPEGRYSLNMELSKKRTKAVINEILSVIPEGKRALKQSKDSVAGWDKVADILEKDSFLTEAKQMRDIIAKHPGNIDEQGREIRKLIFYDTLIKDRLSELRSVKCKYVVRIFRPRSPKEIIQFYNEDKQAILSGKRLLDLSYYWTLFQYVTDPVELEALCKSALKMASLKKDIWPLPANILAGIYIDRKQIDTTLLKPYLLPGHKVGYSEMDMNRPDVRNIYNAPEVIANHVQMLMMAYDFDNAARWSELVKTEYPLLNAVCKLMGGYIDDLSIPENKAVADLIKHSSVKNHVIMELHHSKKIEPKTIVPLLQQLPQDEALTDYLKAQRLCLQCELDLQLMKRDDFVREDDGGLLREGESVIPAPTPDQVAAQKAKVATLADDLQFGKDNGYPRDALRDMQQELSAEEKKLKLMQSGKETYTYLETRFTMYDAAKLYLQRCFKKDKKFITIARRDYDIPEDLFYDALGQQKPKK